MALVGFASLSSPEAIAAESPAPDWVRVIEHAPFTERDTSEGVIFGGKLWLSNGYITGGALVRDLWNSTDGIKWNLVTTNTPYDGYAEMTVYAGKVWAVKQSVWNSTDQVNWKQVAEKTPFGVRGYGELLVHDGKMWQLGSGRELSVAYMHGFKKTVSGGLPPTLGGGTADLRMSQNSLGVAFGWQF